MSNSNELWPTGGPSNNDEYKEWNPFLGIYIYYITEQTMEGRRLIPCFMVDGEFYPIVEV